MRTINANELKTRGISAVDNDPETLITVRGKPTHVILTIEKYEALQEAALCLALAEAESDYAQGKYITEDVDDHIKRITK